MNRFFQLNERQTTFRIELSAGVTTFLTMAYIIFVNPAILAAAGVPFTAAATATALGAALMSIMMGLLTNRPIALASGMGLNAMLAFSIIGFQQSHVPWQVGMAVVLVEGILILFLVLSGFREAVMNAIPLNLKRAIGVGIGLFITVIGLNEGGIIRPAPITLVAIGDLSQRYVWVTLIGLFAIVGFRALKVHSFILCGILTATGAALFMGITAVPSSVVAPLDLGTFFAPFQTVNGSMAIAQIVTPSLIAAVFALMLTDFFDTMGSIVAVGEQAGFVGKDGSVPGVNRILTVDSIGAAMGGLFGASSITTYVESASGVAQGGRTGLMPVVTGLCFAAAAFFTPVIQMIGGGYKLSKAEQYVLFSSSGFSVHPGEYYMYPITAGALIVVGFLMINIVREIDWDRFEEAFPAFLTIIGIPMTYSISHGVGIGFITYMLIRLMSGRWRELHPFMYVVSMAFLLGFLLPHLPL